jgi:hypothetical protein
MTKFKPGDRIVVPWSPGTVAGTVLSLFPGEEYARLVLEFPSDDDRPRLQTLTLPVDLLERAPRSRPGAA